MKTSVATRWKRIGAFLVDWILSGLPAIVGGELLMAFPNVLPRAVAIALFFVLFLSFPALVVLRDILFKGRSLGKRLFGLTVLDAKTAVPAGAKQRFVRNLFFFLLYIDGILLLITGETVGDHVAGTVVISKTELRPPREHKKLSNGKIAAIAVVSVLVVILLFIGLIFGIVTVGLEAVKDSEEYALAYGHLVTSEAFAFVGAKESDVRLNAYSTSVNYEDGQAITTTNFSFAVDTYAFTVTCHRENGQWYVCDECTLFD